MKKIFIFSNTFVSRTLLLGINYIFSFKVSHILLLKENFMADTAFLKKNQNIITYNNIQDCIVNCDLIFIIDDKSIPYKSIQNIQELAIKYKKEVLKIQNPYINFVTDKMQDYKLLDLEYDKIPVVLCVSLSSLSQQLYVELLINKILNNKNVAFKQIFSNETDFLLNQIKMSGYLRDNLTTSSDVYSLIVQSINTKDLQSLKNHLEYIRYIKPDYILLLVDEKFNQYSLVKNIMEYGAFSNLDIIIKSHYTAINQTYILYCDEVIDSNEKCIDIENSSLEQVLSDSIVSKIAMPVTFVKF